MSLKEPGQGQPLDSSYIANIVRAINDLYTMVASTFSNSQISTKESGKQVLKTTDVVMDAGYEVVTNSISSSNSEITQSHKFGSTFKYPPVVTATAMIDNTISGKTINVYVKNVTTTSADIVVKFGTSDTTSTTVNILAVGLSA